MRTSPAPLGRNERSVALETSLNGHQLSENTTSATQNRSESVVLRTCRTCKIIIFSWIAIVAGSLAIGLWRSFATGDEGKGFTDAAYMVATGSLIMFPIQRMHSRRCIIDRMETDS